MLFSGYVGSVSKPFNLKSSPNSMGMFFTLMVNGGDKSAKYIKCLTYNKNLIYALEHSTKDTIIIVENGYPDTSFSKDYINKATNKEGVYLQHFVVTAWSYLGEEIQIKEEPTKEEVLKILEEPTKQKDELDDWNWDDESK